MGYVELRNGGNDDDGGERGERGRGWDGMDVEIRGKDQDLFTH